MVGKPLMAGLTPLSCAHVGKVPDFIAVILLRLWRFGATSVGNPLAPYLPLCLGMCHGSQLSTVCAAIHVRLKMYCATNCEHCAAVPLLALGMQPHFVSCTQPVVTVLELKLSKLKLEEVQILRNRMVLDAYFCELCLNMHQLCPQLRLSSPELSLHSITQ